MQEQRPSDRATTQSCARLLAIRLNNRAWDLIEQPTLGLRETDEMLDTAHAARELWAIATGSRSNIESLRAHHAVTCAHYRAGHREEALHAARLAEVEERSLPLGITQFDRVMTLVSLHLAAMLSFGAPLNEPLMEMVEQLGLEERMILSRILPWPEERFLLDQPFAALPL